MTTPPPQPKGGSVIRLMGTTPMRDWIRGRLSGRLDRERLLHEASLPPPISDLIARVVRRTRLWRLEKADVTRELIAHFRDGLDAGADPAALATDFGDPARAARLIRRAKRRNRPFAWRAMIISRNALAGLLLLTCVVYAGLALRYFSGRPTLSRDYLAEINAPAAAVPEARRAWPIYREAMLLIPAAPEQVQPVEGAYGQLAAADPRKPMYRDYLRSAGPALEALAPITGRPRMGQVITNQVDRELQDRWDRRAGRTPMESAGPTVAPDASGMLVSVLLPSLGEIRHLARTLSADARLAAEEHDLARLSRDLRLLASMPDHMSDHPFLIGQLVGLGLLTHASLHIAEYLRDHPELLDDDLLKDLAHRLSSYGGGGHARILLAGETAIFDDVVQHLFTDDGQGDGRLTPAGSLMAQSLLSPPLTPEEQGLAAWAGPIRMSLTASRADIVRIHRLLMADVATYNEQPLWVRGDPPALPDAGPLFRLRYWPIVALSPAFGRIQYNCDIATLRRDSTLTAIALELHHRRTGSYPADLSALTPQLLPTAPIDQFDGGPLRFKTVDGLPLLYSIGIDRKDDGGRAIALTGGNAPSWQTPKEVATTLADPATRGRIDGDWILFPPPRLPDMPLPEPPPEPAPATAG